MLSKFSQLYIPVISCTADPQLPDGLSIDNNCVITGVASSPLEKTEYLIIADNGYKIGRLFINITISSYTIDEGCEIDGNTILDVMFNITDQNNNMYFKIADKDGSEIDNVLGSSLENYSNYTYRYCIKKEKYYGIVGGTSQRSGWNHGSVSFKLNGMKLKSFSLVTGNEVTYTIDGIFIFII